MAGDCAGVLYHHPAVTGNHRIKDALKESRQSTKKAVPVIEDPNLDPFYLERALEASRKWDAHPDDESEVDLEDLENEYFMSYMTEEIRSPPVVHRDHRVQSGSRHHQEKTQSLRKYSGPTTPTFQRSPNHYSQDSCSSVQSDASRVTPDLTPSSSFSSTCSDTGYPVVIRKPSQREFSHSHRPSRERTHHTPRFYLPDTLPLDTPGTQVRPYARSHTPIERSATAALAEYHNLSSETLTMVPKDSASPAASSLYSKPLPSLPPILKNSGPTTTHSRKCQNGGLKSQIDPSLISLPSLVNPVTKEPHMSPFNHALFIPAHDCPSPVPNPSSWSPLVARQNTNTSSKERPSTSTSVAHGEQSVWESDSETGSISGKTQSRCGPIDTLRKVRSRVQLRRIAKSDAKLQADLNNINVTTITTTNNSAGGTVTTCTTNIKNHDHGHHRRFRGAPPPLDKGQPDAGVHLSPPQRPTLLAGTSVTSIPDDLPPPPPPLKQTLRLVAPSTTSLLRPQSWQQSSEKLSEDINSSTAAAIQAQSRRRQRSNATDEFVPFPKTEPVHSYCNSHVLPSSGTVSPSTPSIDQSTVFRRIWGSLRSLDCRGG